MLCRRFHFLLLVIFAIAIRIARSDDCQKVGPQCSPDGKKIWLCTEKGKSPAQEDSCSDDEQCKEEKGQVACMKQSSSELRFKCTGQGEFPDPSNCSRTYICSDGNEKPEEVCYCPGGSFVYPQKGLYCVPDECPWKNIKCEEGASGLFELKNVKSSYYYYCSRPDVVEVYELVETSASFRSEKNGKKCQHFEDTKTTVEPPETTKETTVTPEPTKNTTPKATESPTTPKPEEKPKCESAGEFYSTECDCDFYECDDKLVPKRRTCRKGMLYSEKFKKCIYGDCDPSKCINRPK